MSWRPRDCHAHTVHSDGALTPAELVAIVEARGVGPSITDHASSEMTTGISSQATFDAYVADIALYPVARGAEFCWHDSLWRELPAASLASLTHCLGSLHGIWLDDGQLVHAFIGKFPQGLEVQSYMDALVANAERFAREMPVDILAHPTLVHFTLRDRPAEELWTEEREERLVAALAATDIAFELSNRYRPHERLVRRAASAGVRFALGSDGHAAEQVGDVAYPLALARLVGVPDEELYDPLNTGARHA